MYTLLRRYIQFGLQFYFYRIKIQGKERLNENGPIIIAVNHPNSFLDAILLAALSSTKMYFLARGEVFTNNVIDKTLRFFHLILLYNMKNGRLNLKKNKEAYADSTGILNKANHLLIFSEGISKNEWRVRPLAKTTARIAFLAWQGDETAQTVRILPVGLFYSHFNGVGKYVHIEIGQFINKENVFDRQKTKKEQIDDLNNLLYRDLSNLSLPVKAFPKDKQLEKIISIIFILPWVITHGIYYLVIQSITKWLTYKTVYYDSCLFVIFLLTYPFYWLLMCFICYMYLPFEIFLGALFMPIYSYSFKLLTYHFIKKDLR